MSFVKFGINFRATSGYVTDGTDEYFGDGSASQTINGFACGWSSDKTADDRDRTASSPASPRAAGLVHCPNDGSPDTFRITGLPPGDYKIGIMVGDAVYSHTSGKIELKDGSTSLYPITLGSTAYNTSRDINNGLHDHLYDFDTIVQTVTIVGGTLNVVCGDSSGDYTELQHLYIEQISDASTTYDNTHSDGVKLSDTVTISVKVQASDGAKLSDTLTLRNFTVGVHPTSGVKLEDSFALEIDSVLPGDGYKISDTPTAKIDLRIARSDGVKLSDTPSALINAIKQQSDGVKLSDTISLPQADLRVTLSDGVKFSDSNVANVAGGSTLYNMSFADGIAGGDQVTSGLSLSSRVHVDGVKLSDTVSLLHATLSIRCADGVKLGDAPALPDSSVIMTLTDRILLIDTESRTYVIAPVTYTFQLIDGIKGVDTSVNDLYNSLRIHNDGVKFQDLLSISLPGDILYSWEFFGDKKRQ